MVVKQEESQYDDDEDELHEGLALWVWGEGAVSGGGADLLVRPGPGLPPLDRYGSWFPWMFMTMSMSMRRRELDLLSKL